MGTIPAREEWRDMKKPLSRDREAVDFEEIGLDLAKRFAEGEMAGE